MAKYRGELRCTMKHFIGLSTETKTTINVNVGSTFYETDTRNEYLFDGIEWQEYKMRYKDLGLVIDAVNVAVGATVYSQIYDNCHLYNGVFITFQQNGNVGTNAISAYVHGVPTGDTLLGGVDYGGHGSTQSSCPSGAWVQMVMPRFSVAGNIVIDKKTRFGFRNNTGNTSAFTTFKVRIELIRN